MAVGRRTWRLQSPIKALKMAHSYSSLQYQTSWTIYEPLSHLHQPRSTTNSLHVCAKQKYSFSMTWERSRVPPGPTRNSSSYSITVTILAFRPSSLLTPEAFKESMNVYAPA